MRPVTLLQSRQAVGALQMCAGMLTIPFLDVFAKLLGATHEPFEITFWRFFMQTALMLPFVMTLRLWTVPSGTLFPQAVRGLLLAMATVFFFAALKHLPMAEAIAIFFAQPMILTVLSALMLGERLRARRIGAIIAGMGGTLIILQPSILIFGWPALLPLASALSMALYMVLTRKLASDVNPYQMQFLGSVAAMIGLGLVVLAGTVFSIPGVGMSMLTGRELMWVIGMGNRGDSWTCLHRFCGRKGPRQTCWRHSSMSRSSARRHSAISYSRTFRQRARSSVSALSYSAAYICFHRERVVGGTRCRKAMSDQSSEGCR